MRTTTAVCDTFILARIDPDEKNGHRAAPGHRHQTSIVSPDRTVRVHIFRVGCVSMEVWFIRTYL